VSGVQDAICYNPGVSTQIDGFAHIGWNGKFMNGAVNASDIWKTGETFTNLQHMYHDYPEGYSYS